MLSGFGLGLAYIVPIAMLQKWFPDKRGLITGIAVAGFGFGAVITSPVAQRMIAGFKDPPAGCTVAGAPAAAAGTEAKGSAGRDLTQQEALSTPQWYMLTAILTLSVTAGISLISVAASTATDVAGVSSADAATLVGIMGLFNGAGRILWAAISDQIGRMPAFVGILAIQGLCLIAIPHAGSAQIFSVLAALIGEDEAYTLAYTVIGVIGLVGAIIPIITKTPAARREVDATA